MRKEERGSAWIVGIGGAIWCIGLPTLIVLLTSDRPTIILSLGLWTGTQNGQAGASLVWPIVWFYGFFLATFGLYLAGRRTEETARQNTIAEQGQMTERYTRAVEQLGHKSPAVRMGGMFALEQIAEESDKYRPQCYRVLEHFIRYNSPQKEKGE